MSNSESSHLVPASLSDHLEDREENVVEQPVLIPLNVLQAASSCGLSPIPTNPNATPVLHLIIRGTPRNVAAANQPGNHTETTPMGQARRTDLLERQSRHQSLQARTRSPTSSDVTSDCKDEMVEQSGNPSGSMARIHPHPPPLASMQEALPTESPPPAVPATQPYTSDPAAAVHATTSLIDQQPNAQGAPSRRRIARWTEEDLKQALAMDEQGFSKAEIADALGKSEQAVTAKLWRNHGGDPHKAKKERNAFDM